MKLNLFFKVRDSYGLRDPVVYVNGQPVRFSPVEKGGYAVEAQTEENGEFEIRIIRKSLLSIKYWFGWTVLFWFFGIFGLFAPRFKKYEEQEIFYSASGKADADAHINFDIVSSATGDKPVVTAESDVPLCEEGVLCAYNAKVKKRRKIYKIFNILFRIAVVLGAALGVLLYLI